MAWTAQVTFAIGRQSLDTPIRRGGGIGMSVTVPYTKSIVVSGGFHGKSKIGCDEIVGRCGVANSGRWR